MGEAQKIHQYQHSTYQFAVWSPSSFIYQIWLTSSCEWLVKFISFVERPHSGTISHNWIYDGRSIKAGFYRIFVALNGFPFLTTTNSFRIVFFIKIRLVPFLWWIDETHFYHLHHCVYFLLVWIIQHNILYMSFSCKRTWQIPFSTLR